jgi:predicted RND superfamily exporter protein
MPKNDSARLTSEWIDDTFGSSTFILIGLEREYGDVFDPNFLGQLKEFINKVEIMDVVDEVTSLINTDYITGKNDAVVVEKLVGDDFRGSESEIDELKQRITSWDMYEHALVSDDFSATQIIVSLDIESENAGDPEVVEKIFEIRDLAREMFQSQSTVYVTGLPVLSGTISESMESDLVLLIPLVIIVVFCVLFFSFRRLSFVLLPLLTVFIAVIWTMGAMPLLGIQLTILSIVLPVILVAVGSAYGIHVITHYQEDSRDKVLNRDEHKELIFALIDKIAKPVLLAALTTFIGFFAFIFTPVLPIREFGIFACMGVLASFLISLTLIPALLIIRGPFAEKKHKRNTAKLNTLNDDIARMFLSVARKKRFVLAMSAGFIFASLFGLSRVVIDNAFVEYFQKNSDISRSDEFIRTKFGGSKIVNVVVQADNSESLLQPEVLTAMDGLSYYLSSRVPNVGKTMGFTDIIKRVNQVFNVGESPDGIRASMNDANNANEDDSSEFGGFGDFGFDDTNTDESYNAPITATQPQTFENDINPTISIEFIDKASNRSFSVSGRELARELERLTNYNGMAYYEIPSDPERYGKTSGAELGRIVSNYLVLLSGNISKYANDPLEPTAIKMTVQMRTTGQNDSNEVIAHINKYIADNFPGTVKVTVGGIVLVEEALNNYIIQAQIISIGVSILMVFLIIAVSNKSGMAGLIGSIPLTVSILINFAIMGFMGIKLNIATALIASVSIGIGVDYTIHFLEAYKREWKAANGEGDFLKRAFTNSGKAIIINALSVGAGFAVMLLSEFTVLREFGLLIAIAMLTSSMVSLTLIPVLLETLKPKFVCNA